jgi:lipopolysaccharide transport system ATP-binding protein
MSDTVIKVEDLGKKYLIRHQQSERYTALRDVLTNKFKSLGQRIISLQPHSSNLQPSREEFWVLRDVSFEVKQGDRIGIIGRNGAGKTTLLKLLSRITEPTSGRIAIKGRVASLLEVGTGFHPELTGRENIFLNGAILGMSKSEIKEKFDEIVDFAEIEKFLDTPVKRYSSGMYVRLAFAVAAHLEPEILLVDEVLAVGDAAFQKKCLGKMEDIAGKGRTVLFVSHNMGAILSFCNTAVLLHEGKVLSNGKVRSVIDKYSGVKTEQKDSINLMNMQRPDQFKSRALLTEVSLLNGEKIGSWQLPFGNDIRFGVGVKALDHLPWLELLVALKTVAGFEIASTLSFNHLPKEPFKFGTYFFELTYNDLLLNPGIYRFDLALKSERGLEDYLPEAFDLEIVVSEKSAEMNVHKVLGALIPRVSIQVKNLEAR